MVNNLYKRLRLLSPRMIYLILTLVVSLLFFTSFSDHPYYMSVTEIDYLHEKKEIEISCKIFSDDFEEALSLTYGKKIKLIESFQYQSTDSLVFRYLKKHLLLLADTKNLELKWEGKELQGESVWCYLSVSSVPLAKNLIVENNLLVHYREEQINIVHMKSGNTKNSCRLVNPEKKCVLRLQ